MQWLQKQIKELGWKYAGPLAANGVTEVLTARDEKRGHQALATLKHSGLSNMVLHQLDVGDPASIGFLAYFHKTQFEKLHILVNNAGVSALVVTEAAALNSLLAAYHDEGRMVDNFNEIVNQSFEMAEECLNINYYGPNMIDD